MISKRNYYRGRWKTYEEESHRFSGSAYTLSKDYLIFGYWHRLYGSAMDVSFGVWYINDKNLLGFKKKIKKDL